MPTYLRTLTPSRAAKLRTVLQHRQPTLAVLLENVHDTMNVSAVIRSCDSVGVMELFVLHTQPSSPTTTVKMGKRSSAGTFKWLDVHLYQQLDTCLLHIKQRGYQLYTTSLQASSPSLYDLNLTVPVCLAFGNEHEGISPALAQAADGNFQIPQVGMSQSLNISVAAAVSLYEAFRQRQVSGMYNSPQLSAEQQEALYTDFSSRYGDARKMIYPAEAPPPLDY